jgi:hypothetical protein
MTDENTEIVALLDRYVANPYVDPPTAAIIAAGRRRLRRIRAAGVVGSIVAVAVVIGGVSIAIGGSARDTHGGLPVITGTGPSASRLAHGHWIKIPKTPIRLCDPLSVSIASAVVVLSEPYDGDGSVPSCRGAAALYDPRMNQWRKLPTPKYSTNQDRWIAAWGGGRLVLVSALNGRTQSWQPGAKGWTELPSLDKPGARSMIWSGSEFVLNTVNVDYSHNTGTAATFALDGTTWKALATIPQPARGYVADSQLVEYGSSTYALTNNQNHHNNPGDSFISGSVHLYRLDDNSWTALPIPKGVPKTQLRLTSTPFGIVVAGSRCPSSCTLEVADAALVRPRAGGSTTVTSLRPPNNLVPYPSDTTTGPSAFVLTYPQAAIGDITIPTPKIGPVQIFDLARTRWLKGPTETKGSRAIGDPVWTNYGVVTDGWLLRPAPR